MLKPDAVTRVAVVGAGTIGASWTAQFLARGLSVTVTDPNPQAEAFVRAYVEKAWPALERLGLAADADPAAWRFHADPRAAVAGAEFVQESGPENADVKRALYAEIEDALDDSAIFASSTSGLIMSELQQGRRIPERFVVGHPFNPPHLIPLVEVVGGAQTAPEVIDRTMAFYHAIGKRPIRLNREVPGHLANRLQAALWREAVHAVASGLASVEDVDLAISEGPGLRWALMGPHMIFNLGGGTGGMEHFLHHLGPNIETWWRDLGTPSLTPDVAEMLITGCREAAHGRSNAELAAERDRLLMALLELLQRERGTQN